jgi:hypothetical protein
LGCGVRREKSVREKERDEDVRDKLGKQLIANKCIIPARAIQTSSLRVMPQMNGRWENTILL